MQFKIIDCTEKDISSLGAPDGWSKVRCAAKSSVIWLGSPPGTEAHIGHTYKQKMI